MRRLLLVLFLASCSRKDEPQSSPVAATSASVGAEAAARRPSDVAWDVPKSWTDLPNTSAIRKATYGVPKVTGEAEAQCTVTKAGGTVDANVERWKGMFESPTFKKTKMDVAGIGVTFVELRGSYADTMTGAAPKPQEMLAAVIETEPELTFFKLLGPEKTVEAAKGDFLHLVESVRPK